MTDTVQTDLCVIGAGSGGLAVAAGAVQMGASVVLVEQGAMGGDCLNYGCVPSKSLIAAAKAPTPYARPAASGSTGTSPRSTSSVHDHVHGVIAAIAPHDSQARFESLGVKVIRAAGRFTGPREVEADGIRVRARRFVVATGSSPAIPAVPGLEDVPHITNETIFDLTERPAGIEYSARGTRSSRCSIASSRPSPRPPHDTRSRPPTEARQGEA